MRQALRVSVISFVWRFCAVVNSSVARELAKFRDVFSYSRMRPAWMLSDHRIDCLLVGWPFGTALLVASRVSRVLPTIVLFPPPLDQRFILRDGLREFKTSLIEQLEFVL